MKVTEPGTVVIQIVAFIVNTSLHVNLVFCPTLFLLRTPGICKGFLRNKFVGVRSPSAQHFFFPNKQGFV